MSNINLVGLRCLALLIVLIVTLAMISANKGDVAGCVIVSSFLLGALLLACYVVNQLVSESENTIKNLRNLVSFSDKENSEIRKELKRSQQRVKELENALKYYYKEESK